MTINLDQYTNTLSVTDTAANADLTVVSKGTGAVNLNTGNGTAVRIADFSATTVAGLGIFAGSSGQNTVYVSPYGSGAGSNLVLASKGTGFVILATNTSNNAFITEQMRVTHTASAVNYVQATGAATGSGPTISAQGSDTNAVLSFLSKGSAGFDFQNSASAGAFGIELAGNTSVDKITFIDFHSSAGTDFDFRLARQGGVNNFITYVNAGTGGHAFQTAGGTEQLRVAHTASAVNYVQVTGAATTVAPNISAQGSDTNIPLRLSSKGDATIYGVGNGSTIFDVYGPASSANYVRLRANAAGTAPALQSFGTDTNIDLALTPKGTGNVRFGTHTGTADTAVSGYIEIKDSGGTIRKLAVIT